MIYEYQAKLDRVVDGDTVWLDVDLGFRCHARMVFRLYGIDTPELIGASRSGGLAAKYELERLLSLGPLRIVTYKVDSADKYGRWLATLYVTLSTGTIDVNEALVIGGHAQRYTGGAKP